MEQQALANRWLYYILSVFFPPILGLVLFFLLRTRSEADAPQVARHSLIIGVVSFATVCILCAGFSCLFIFAGAAAD